MKKVLNKKIIRLSAAVLCFVLTAALFAGCAGQPTVRPSASGQPTVDTPTPTSDTPVPTSDTPVPTSDTSTPTVDTPTPTTDTPTPTVDTPTSSTDTPTPTVDTTTPSTDTPAPTTGDDKKVVASFTMLAAGDNLLHSGIVKDAMEKARPGVDEDFWFDDFYKDVKAQISSADCAVINQESIILPKRIWQMLKHRDDVRDLYIRKDGSFVTPQEMYDTLARLGFDAVDMANNHALDMGAGGLQWSLDYLNGRSEMFTFGAYYDEEDRQNIRVAEYNGIKVAFLGYTYDTNVPADHARAEEPGYRFLVPVIDDEKMIADLRAAREIADFVAVFVHWGTEYSFEPDELQRHTAKVLAENGAGIIIGHHSHTLQPVEYLSDGKGGRVLCAYSLGTLVSNMMYDMNMLAGFLSFRVNLTEDGAVFVSDALFTPTVFYYDMSFRSSRLLYLGDLTPDMAASHGIGNYSKNGKKNTMTVERLYEYLHGVIDDAFLPEKYRSA